MGGYLSIDSSQKKCHCSNDSYIATFRCQLTVHNTKIMSSEYKIIMDKLEPYAIYWTTVYCKESEDTIQTIGWVACNYCITDDIKKYFTNHPLGWLEEDTDDDYIIYEKINLLHEVNIDHSCY